MTGDRACGLRGSQVVEREVNSSVIVMGLLEGVNLDGLLQRANYCEVKLSLQSQAIVVEEKQRGSKIQEGYRQGFRSEKESLQCSRFCTPASFYSNRGNSNATYMT